MPALAGQIRSTLSLRYDVSRRVPVDRGPVAKLAIAVRAPALNPGGVCPHTDDDAIVTTASSERVWQLVDVHWCWDC
jgi:hypothetical protein